MLSTHFYHFSLWTTYLFLAKISLAGGIVRCLCLQELIALVWLLLIVLLFLMREILLRIMLSHHFSFEFFFFSQTDEICFWTWGLVYPGSKWALQKMLWSCVCWDVLNSCPELISFIFHVYSNCEFSLAWLNTLHLLNDCVFFESQIHWVTLLGSFYCC